MRIEINYQINETYIMKTKGVTCKVEIKLAK